MKTYKELKNIYLHVYDKAIETLLKTGKYDEKMDSILGKGYDLVIKLYRKEKNNCSWDESLSLRSAYGCAFLNMILNEKE